MQPTRYEHELDEVREQRDELLASLKDMAQMRWFVMGIIYMTPSPSGHTIFLGGAGGGVGLGPGVKGLRTP